MKNKLQKRSLFTPPLTAKVKGGCHQALGAGDRGILQKIKKDEPKVHRNLQWQE